MSAAAFGLALLLGAGAPGAAAPLVPAQDVVRGLVVDLRYATKHNFLGRAVYPKDARCLLLPDTAERLAQAARLLSAQGYRLKVYDCYRPLAVQWQMWKLFPKPGYVADPRKGSNHNRGAAVDLTLVTSDGDAVEMPTPFDTFSRAAHQGYGGGSARSRANRERLRGAMEAAGFKPNRMEWWHFDLPGATKLPVLDVPFDAKAAP
jgi:zinc D-Ala-D-Ala dipeptidase